MVYRFPIPIVLALLTGCSGVVRDSGPSRPMDFSHVPDAVPRVETRTSRGNPDSYVVFNRRYTVLKESDGFVERGIASWYGKKFHGRLTANGERYDMYGMTAAHKHLPLPTYVSVTNILNQKSVIVRVNDRGPFHEDRIIDLSYAAASKLGLIGHGTAVVEVAAIDPAQWLAEQEAKKQAAANPASAAAPEEETAITAEPQARPATLVSTAATVTPLPTSTTSVKGTEIHPVKVTASPVDDNTPAPLAPGETVLLQVGAFSERDNAEKLRDKLARNQIGPIRIETQPGERTVYRVRVGPVDAETHDTVISRLNAQGLTPTRVSVQ